MSNIRQRMMKRLPWARQLEQEFLVPVRGAKLRFDRCRLARDGWIWWVFPRYKMVTARRSTNFANPVAAASRAASLAVGAVGADMEAAIASGIDRSVKLRTTRATNLLLPKVEELVAGTEALPTKIAQIGRSSSQQIQKSIVQAVGSISADEFRSIVSKSVAQMIIYARDEADKDAAELDTPLPTNTRFYRLGSRRNIFVIEEAPRVRTVFWDNREKRLALPYCIFTISIAKNKFEEMGFYFRNAPLSSRGDTLHLATMADIDPRGRVCFPGPQISDGAPHIIVQSAILSFWQSQFRSAHWNGWVLETARTIPNFRLNDWEAQSSKDPKFALSVQWPAMFPLAKILRASGEIKTNASTSVNALQQYADTLSQKVSAQIQELVVARLSRSIELQDVKKTFDTELRSAVASMDIAPNVARLMRATLLAGCDPDNMTDIAKMASAKAARELSDQLSSVTQAYLEALGQELAQSECSTMHDSLSDTI